jgi:hypothetical protein
MRHELEQLRCGYEKRGFDQIKDTVGPAAFRSMHKTRNLMEERRRSLLGDSVRVTRDLLPEVYEVYQKCLQLIGGDLDGDLYIQQSPVYNAHVLGAEGRFDLVVHSALLKDFNLDELSFVIGHELGHVLFGHSDFSVHEYLNSQGSGVDSSTASVLFKWSRAAEVSADRVGMLCCGTLSNACSALFKTSSGLSGVSVDRILRSFRAQYDELVAHIHDRGGGHEWVRTHPMIPIRFKAIELVALDMTALRAGGNMFSWSGFRTVDNTIAELLEQLDVEVSNDSGIFSEDGGLCVVSALLYLALGQGSSVGWRERAFVHDVHREVRCQTELNDMIEAVNRDAASFRAQFKDEMQRLQGALRSRDFTTLLEVCGLMLVKCEVDSASTRSQLGIIAEFIGQTRADAETAINRMKTDKPSLSDLF